MKQAQGHSAIWKQIDEGVTILKDYKTQLILKFKVWSGQF